VDEVETRIALGLLDPQVFAIRIKLAHGIHDPGFHTGHDVA